MPREMEPNDTNRAAAYALWMKAPNPMVTFFKTLDVTNLVRLCKRRHLKFNMLLNYCIGRAAAPIKEFYMLPVGDRLVRYDALAVNTIVKNRAGSSAPVTFWLQLILRPSTVSIGRIHPKRQRAVRTGICPPTAW